MSLPGETVVVLTGTPKMDPYSGEQTGTDWTNPSESPVGNVLCEPRPSGEPVQAARNAVTSGWTLYFQGEPTTPPTAQDRIRVRGIDYQVMGEPSDWRLGSWRPGIVVQVERVTG